MKQFRDKQVVTAILGIGEYGDRIGYERHRSVATIYSNLVTGNTEADLVSADIAAEAMKNRLNFYSDNSTSLPPHYTASPLGLTDKSDGSKRRIHHLS